MKFIITENRRKEVFDSYMDRLTKDLVRNNNRGFGRTVSFEDPDAGENDYSVFDYEPYYIYYDNMQEDVPEENYRTAFWMQCEMVENLKALFGFDEETLYEYVKDWAEHKYNLRITDVTCQG
jgi:hypothetical protein